MTSPAGYLLVKSSGPSPKNKTSTSSRPVDQIPRRMERRLWLIHLWPSPPCRFESNSRRVGNSVEYQGRTMAPEFECARMHLFALPERFLCQKIEGSRLFGSCNLFVWTRERRIGGEEPSLMRDVILVLSFEEGKRLRILFNWNL